MRHPDYRSVAQRVGTSAAPATATLCPSLLPSSSPISSFFPLELISHQACMDLDTLPEGFVRIRVELPSHSHVFNMTVAEATLISGVKSMIESQCSGSPRVDGQRLIYRGRILQDNEIVKDVWKDQVRR
jgi:hypothetical protein